MEKRKWLTCLFCLILCYSLFQHIARAQSSSQASVFSQGSITYLPSNVNLAVIPDDWNIGFGNGPQIIFLDYTVVHTLGKPSIRLEPHTSADVNTARECDGTWYPVKPGDHIVAKCWIKTDNSTPTENADPYHGGRIGIDFYAPLGNGHITIVDGLPGNVNPYFGDPGANHLAAMVHWNTSVWTLKTWDIIIPSVIYTKDVLGNTIPATPITQCVLWMQAMQVNDGTALGNAWFADAELYINPT
jgi:hypothetical protein